MKVSASVLACNTLELKEKLMLAQDAGIDYIHVDIMDGDYVENFTYGPQFITELKGVAQVPVEVHLEVGRADRYIDMFHRAGADRMIIQRDGCMNPIRTLNKIKGLGMKAGIGLNPADSVDQLSYLLPHADFVVMMSVEPGFGGQTFETSCFQKLELLQKVMGDMGIRLPVLVDGGVNLRNAGRLVSCGATCAVVGTAVFGQEDIGSAVKAFQEIGPVEDMISEEMSSIEIEKVG